MRSEGEVRLFEARKDVASLRFGPYELDLKSGELWRSGTRVRAQHQPLKVLTLLASRPGEVLTREEIQREIWPDGVFVDFEQSLNFCIRHIRGVLNDSAATPHYIETLPKRGYRWIAPVEEVRRDEPLLRPIAFGRPVEIVPPPKAAVARKMRWPYLVSAGVVLLLLGAGSALFVRAAPPQPVFHRLTFQRGAIHCARFTPDGQVVFAAQWDGQPTALYAASESNLGWRRLDTGTAGRIVAVLSSGEIVYLDKGSLVRSPLSGGPPKTIAENVAAADGTADGQTYVATRGRGPHTHIEWPMGRVVTEAVWPTDLRLAPRGDRFAFLEHPTFGDDRGYVVLVDKDGHRKQLTPAYGSTDGLAWSPSGDEIFFTAASSGVDNSLWAVSLSGRTRLVLATMGRLTIQDVSPTGRVLLVKSSVRGETRFGREGQEERDLSWLDFSSAAAFSPEAGTLVFSETGEGGGPDYGVYLRSTESDSVPVRLGHGTPMSLSNDGKWVATVPIRNPDHLELLPTGAGEIQSLRDSQISQYQDAAFMPDGQSLLVSALVRDGAHSYMRVFQQPLTGRAKPVSPEGVMMVPPGPSPDGKFFLGRSEKGVLVLPLDGGPPPVLVVDALTRGLIVGWKDPTTIYLDDPYPGAAMIDSIDLRTGKRARLRSVGPKDKAGVAGLLRFILSADGKSWVYSYARVLSDLYTVEKVS